jgi:hypothetical protein
MMNQMMNHLDNLLGDDLRQPRLFQEEVGEEREVRARLSELPRECRSAEQLLHIDQAFIARANEICDVRIRRCSEVGGDTIYSMTAKYRPAEQECETTITREVFEALWPNAESKQRKLRYVLQSGWVVDDIKGEGIVAECEYEGTTKPVIPRAWSLLRASSR